ncbi:hypothetical protein LZQ00_14555 [Sphingobacterium sp. SRCM116780]|uniref:DUF6896 domain-containing protein n=1 Tax=Sphingobacterium sp. SRCM116780 TaxID=2907623 RepID=UPI001F20B192|nr:hypothetical protein [Sphingobacterium sp. SRCM116780]UIR55480.1 hypothetical protein LZQ00_14555 [Sphingobacterium sp. SRCM116780]
MKNIENIVVDYYEFIQNYKDLIKEQNKDESYFIKERKGEIGGYKFWYHGAGCRLEKEGTACEFDYLPENGFPVKFTNWEIYEFINTSRKWPELNPNLDDIHISLMALVQQNKLFLLELDGVKFPVFQMKDVTLFN